MKRYAILMALAAMLCGTEAGAVTLGFDQVNTSSFVDVDHGSSVTPNPGDFQLALGGSWAVEGGDFISNITTSSSSSFLVHGVPNAAEEARNEYPEFTFQGVDLYVKEGGPVLFTIDGYELSKDLGQKIYSYSFNVTTSQLVTDGITDNNGKVLDLSQIIGHLRISGGSSTNSTIGVGCMEFGSGGAYTACDGSTSNIPEPASLLLLGAGLAGIGIWRRKARG